ncbi:MAG TPA: hypothetical protein VFD07_09605 [Candidatus Krumholzibacteria bacterium]|nr:hypothetical protein [Candidatus Krumholzibacteria bacterium]
MRSMRMAGTKAAPRTTHNATAISTAAACVWALGLVITTPVFAARSGIVLHETHAQSQVSELDTIVTYITAKHVRVSHPGGHSLLDLAGDRIVLMDPATRTYRQMSLQQWDARIREAVGDVDTSEATTGATFTLMPGQTEIAGYACDRYHYYGKRTLLGAEETVEQQIWIARNLDMPEGAYSAYQLALERIESIGAGAVLHRPAGVVLALETRTRSAATDRRHREAVEQYTVIRVETTTLPDSLFTIPRGYAPAVLR